MMFSIKLFDNDNNNDDDNNDDYNNNSGNNNNNNVMFGLAYCLPCFNDVQIKIIIIINVSNC